jgi:hypothetical protein
VKEMWSYNALRCVWVEIGMDLRLRMLRMTSCRAIRCLQHPVLQRTKKLSLMMRRLLQTDHTDTIEESEKLEVVQDVVGVIEEPTCPLVEPVSKASHTIVEAKDSGHDDLPDDFSPQLGSDSETEAVLDSTSEGAVVVNSPRGVYHRQTYSRHAGRRYCVKGSGKSAAPRLSPPRLRFFKVHCGVYVAKTRKRTVAFQCYAACSLARLLLGKKPKLQRRLRAAVKTVLAQGSCTLLDLQVAWHLAGVKKVDEEEMAWEEVWMEKGQWRRFK